MEFLKKFAFSALILFAGYAVVYAVSRGSGSHTERLRLYKPAEGEDKGWGTDASTNSLAVNSDILESHISSLELNAGNTNYAASSGDADYIQNKATLQSGATDHAEFARHKNIYVSETVNLPAGATNYINNQATLQAGTTFYTSSGTVYANFNVGSMLLVTVTSVTVNGNLVTGSFTGINTSQPQFALDVNGIARVVSSATIQGQLGTWGDFFADGNLTFGNAITDTIQVNAGTTTYTAGHVLNFGNRVYMDTVGAYLRMRIGTNFDGLQLSDGDGAKFIELNPRSTNIGWSVQNATNQACNTTCAHACVIGIDAVTTGFLACTDATADSCLCAGPN